MKPDSIIDGSNPNCATPTSRACPAGRCGRSCCARARGGSGQRRGWRSTGLRWLGRHFRSLRQLVVRNSDGKLHAFRLVVAHASGPFAGTCRMRSPLFDVSIAGHASIIGVAGRKGKSVPRAPGRCDASCCEVNHDDRRRDRVSRGDQSAARDTIERSRMARRTCLTRPGRPPSGRRCHISSSRPNSALIGYNRPWREAPSNTTSSAKPPDPPRDDQFHERLLVDQRATGDIHENGGWSQTGEFCATDPFRVASFSTQWMDTKSQRESIAQRSPNFSTPHVAMVAAST